MTTSETEIQNKFIRGLTWKALIGLVISVASIVASIVSGFNSLQNEVKDIKGDVRSIRYEFRAAIDSVKYKQQVRGIETDAKFDKMEDKLNRIENNTSK